MIIAQSPETPPEKAYRIQANILSISFYGLRDAGVCVLP
jgi:hypothetical protein